MHAAEVVDASAAGDFATLGLMVVTAVVVPGLLALVVRFDPAAALRRHRYELHVRLGTEALLQEAVGAQAAARRGTHRR